MMAVRTRVTDSYCTQAFNGKRWGMIMLKLLIIHTDDGPLVENKREKNAGDAWRLDDESRADEMPTTYEQ